MSKVDLNKVEFSIRWTIVGKRAYFINSVPTIVDWSLLSESIINLCNERKIESVYIKGIQITNIFGSMMDEKLSTLKTLSISDCIIDRVPEYKNKYHYFIFKRNVTSNGLEIMRYYYDNSDILKEIEKEGRKKRKKKRFNQSCIDPFLYPDWNDRLIRKRFGR